MISVKRNKPDNSKKKTSSSSSSSSSSQSVYTTTKEVDRSISPTTIVKTTVEDTYYDNFSPDTIVKRVETYSKSFKKCIPYLEDKISASSSKLSNAKTMFEKTKYEAEKHKNMVRLDNIQNDTILNTFHKDIRGLSEKANLSSPRTRRDICLEIARCANKHINYTLNIESESKIEDDYDSNDNDDCEDSETTTSISHTDSLEHFEKTLEKYQGKGLTRDMTTVIAKIRDHIQKNSLSISDLAIQDIYHILKKIGCTDYNEDIWYLHSVITDTPPDDLSDIIDEIRELARLISNTFNKLKNTGVIKRDNTLNTRVLLYKILEYLRPGDYDRERFIYIKTEVILTDYRVIWNQIVDKIKQSTNGKVCLRLIQTL